MRQIIISLLVILLLITACSKGTITARPIADIKTADIELEVNVTDSADSCAAVVCDSDKSCVNGECVCKNGFKECNEDCIAENSCCNDDDCEEGICEEGVCVNKVCKYNQRYDSDAKDCVCAEGTYYCAAQKKCIPKKNCCMHTVCKTYQRCVPTQFITSICLVKEKKVCKSVIEFRVEPFFFGADRYNVEIKDILNDGVLVLAVNEEELELELNKEKTFMNMTIYMENLEVLGGYCKEY